jgi:hypothetical protein
MFFPSTWIPYEPPYGGSSLLFSCDGCGRPFSSLTWVSTFPTEQAPGSYFTKLCGECLARRNGGNEDEQLMKDIRDAIDRYIQAKIAKGVSPHVPTWWPYPYYNSQSTTGGSISGIESRI